MVIMRYYDILLRSMLLQLPFFCPMEDVNSLHVDFGRYDKSNFLTPFGPHSRATWDALIIAHDYALLPPFFPSTAAMWV